MYELRITNTLLQVVEEGEAEAWPTFAKLVCRSDTTTKEITPKSRPKCVCGHKNRSEFSHSVFVEHAALKKT